MNLFIPSKTFLIGEYAVLSGGRAVVACTRPVFEVSGRGKLPGTSSPGGQKLRDLHRQSPAGRAVHRLNLDPDREWTFFDPHRGQGGFGGSTAEWLGVQLLNSNERDLWKLWSLYREDARPSPIQIPGSVDRGLPPSGTDVIAQLTGGLSVVDLDKSDSRATSWPFPEEHFLIFRTGLKLQTHRHLTGLGKLVTAPLAHLTEEFIGAFRGKHFQSCCGVINRFFQELSRQNLVDQRVAQLIERLRPHVSAVKGCGAMGVDTLVCLVTKAQKASALAAAEALGLQFVASNLDLAAGALETAAQRGSVP